MKKCKNCQFVQNEVNKFCTNCSSTEFEYNLDKQDNKSKSKKKFLLIMSLGLVLITGILIIVLMTINPTNQLIHKLKKDDYETAKIIYDAKIATDEDETERAYNRVYSYAEKVLLSFKKEKINYEQFILKMDGIKSVGILKIHIEDFYEQAEKLYNLRETYISAMKAFEQENYQEAIRLFSEIKDAEFEKQKDCLEKYNQAVDLYRDTVSKKAQECIDAAQYIEACVLLRDALDIIKEDTELLEIQTNLNNRYKTDVLNKIQTSINNGEYTTANELIETALEILGNDNELLLLKEQCSLPSSEVITSDLEYYITNEYDHLSVSSYEIVQSITQDTTYSATLDVSAESKYAEFKLTAYIDYFKYDQGWVCTYCEFEILDYWVVSWPSKEEMVELLEDRQYEVEVCYQDPEYTSLSNDGELFVLYEGTIDTVHDGFVGIKGSIESYWEYNYKYDTFEFYEDYISANLSLTCNIEGEWIDKDATFGGEYIIITDQGTDYFTIECTDIDHKETVYLDTDEWEFWDEGNDWLYDMSECLYFTNSTGDHKTEVILRRRNDGNLGISFETDYDRQFTWDTHAVLE